VVVVFLCMGGFAGHAAPSLAGTEDDFIRSKPDVHDVIVGLGGEDHLSGGVGDRICGGPGDDIVSGARFLSGGSGNDYMPGKKGPNLFRGGRGKDRADLTGGGKDVVRGGPGFDQVEAPSPRISRGGKVVIDLAKGYVTSVLTERTKIYSVEGGSACDWEAKVIMFGTSGHNSLLALCAGEAVLHGRGANDLLWGWQNDDRLYGGPGDDLLRGRGGDDILDGGSGDDTCYQSGGDEVPCE